MCVAVEKEQVVAGFINKHEDGFMFTMKDIYDYIISLWNAGCGPVRLNFHKWEMREFLDCCKGVCLADESSIDKWKIDKKLLCDHMTPEEYKFLHGDKELAKRFDLFCRLQVDLRTPNDLLDAMGFRFLHAE